MSNSIMRIAFFVVSTAGAATAQPGSSYISDLESVLWLVDTHSGNAVQIGQMGLLMRDIAIDSTGQLWGVSETENLYRIDRHTAQIEFVGPLGTSPSSGLDFGPTGTLYLANSPTSGAGLFTVNTATGQAGLIGVNGYRSDGDLAFSETDGLYMTFDNGSAHGLVSIDPADGSAAVIGYHGLGDINGADFVDGNLIGLASGGRIVQLDILNGSGTVLRHTSPIVECAGFTHWPPTDCNPADLAMPHGVLDLADVSAFTSGFLAADPIADLNGDGLFDLADVNLFVTSFLAGCP